MGKNERMGGLIAIIILSCMVLLSMTVLFTKTAMMAKLLAGASIILLLFLITPGWLQIIRSSKL